MIAKSVDTRVLHDALACIHHELPDITLSRTIEHDSCDNYVIEVNDKLIFRFPKKHDTQQRVEAELKILSQLDSKITVQIPRLYHRGVARFFVGYHKIPGVALTPEIYKSLSQNKKDALARDLARFFCELHASVSIQEAQTFGLERAQWPLSIEQLQEKLHNKLPNQKLQNLFERMHEMHKTFEVLKSDIVMVHNDVHEKNIAFDTEQKKLTGIFDFSDLAIGDRYLEFRYLYLISPELMEQAAREYASLIGQEYNKNRVLYYYLATEFSRLTECLYGGCWLQDAGQIVQRLLKF